VTLLNFIRDHETGTYVDELAKRCAVDYRPRVRADVERFRRENKIFVIEDPGDRKTDLRVAVFPAERLGIDEIDADIVEAFHRTEIPRGVLEMQDALEAEGMRCFSAEGMKERALAATAAATVEASAKRRAASVVSIGRRTNVHLPELFQTASGKGKRG
jgi:hypothetical protein